MRRPLPLAVIATLGLAAGCGGDDSASSSAAAESADSSADSSLEVSAVIDPGDGGDYHVDINPADFTSVVDNPLFPMLPGTTWQYVETASDGEQQTDIVEVLDQHREVMGVDTIVVHDVVTNEDGDVVEDTYDWYAQDSAGNVWYFGEDTTSFDEGTTSKKGSWEAGVDGALPGIVMQADPTVSSTGYRQEYLVGTAEDMGQVIADSGSITVPYGTFDDIVQTRDWTPLEPDVVEEKIYARSIGVVHEESTGPDDEHEEVVLVAYTPPA